jgi:hypothetical protein
MRRFESETQFEHYVCPNGIKKGRSLSLFFGINRLILFGFQRECR